MKRAAVLVLVSLAGMAWAGCERQDSTSSTNKDPRIDGVSPSVAVVDPSILDDQTKFYKPKASPAADAAADSQPASQPATQGTADATTAPATQPG